MSLLCIFSAALAFNFLSMQGTSQFSAEDFKNLKVILIHIFHLKPYNTIGSYFKFLSPRTFKSQPLNQMRHFKL